MKPRAVVFSLLALALLAIPKRAAAQFTLDLLHTFAGGTDGNSPQGVPIQDANGNLYGTTAFGGVNCQGGGCGTVFKIDANGNYTVLYRFQGGSDGAAPRAGLAIDTAGNLYGTTQGQGFLGAPSTLFRVDPNGVETVLFTFSNFADGGSANSTPVLDENSGTLYGATPFGGDANCVVQGDGNGCGVIYRLDKGGKFSVIHTFKTFTDGGEPQGGLFMDANGNLYGATVAGGIGEANRVCTVWVSPKVGCGAVFELSADGKFTVLYRFQGEADGASPVAVVVDGAGNLYGITNNGGDFNCYAFGCGTIFKIDTTGAFTVLHTFHAPPSNTMYNNVFRDAEGNLYGSNGYAFSEGYLFELDSSGTFSILYQFSNASNGTTLTGVMLAPNGDFYGTNGTGGDSLCGLLDGGCGTVFKLTP